MVRREEGCSSGVDRRSETVAVRSREIEPNAEVSTDPGQVANPGHVAKDRESAENEPAVDVAQHPHDDSIGAGRREVATGLCLGRGGGGVECGVHGWMMPRRTAGRDTLCYVVATT